MIPYMIGKLGPNSSLSPRGESNMSPVGTNYVAFPPKTGKMLLHLRPPPPIVERVIFGQEFISFSTAYVLFRRSIYSVVLQTATFSNLNLWLGGQMILELKSVKVIYLLMTTRQALRQLHCFSAPGI